MPVLATGSYDPATAVTWPTTAALAMTAMDTVNLRRTFNAPASGIVMVKISCVVHGATSFPQIFLGALNGSTVLGRHAPEAPLGGTSLATTMQKATVIFPVTGLVAGQTYSFDAAYGVETGVSSTAIKCGGPNDTTANNAFGGLIFEIDQVT